MGIGIYTMFDQPMGARVFSEAIFLIRQLEELPMPKVEMHKNKMLQVGPTGNVVLVTCCDGDGRANIITVGMYMPISSNPPPGLHRHRARAIQP